jgi:hypothetical protein
MTLMRHSDVHLSGTEMLLLREIGRLRHSVTSEQGTEKRQDKSQDKEQMAIVGVISEYAVAKRLNLHFNLDCDFRNFGADLVSKSGKEIDVKCTKPGGNLNAVEWSTKKPADIFVLTEMHKEFVRIIGWISRENFLIRQNQKNVGNGSFYSVPQSKLNPL